MRLRRVGQNNHGILQSMLSREDHARSLAAAAVASSRLPRMVVHRAVALLSLSSFLGWVVTATTTPYNQFTLATQTLPAIQKPHVHYSDRFQCSLTPPYTNDPKPSQGEPPTSRQGGFPDYPDRPWSAHRGRRGFDQRPLMSQPATSGSQSNPVDEASRRLQQTGHHPQFPPEIPPSMHSLPRDHIRNGPPGPPVSLPSLRQLSNTPPTPSSDRRPGNPLGVQSILNPQGDLAEQRLEQRGRRRSASQMESPSPIDSQPPPSLPSISRPTSVDSAQEEPALPQRHFQMPGRLSTRHLLSPRSPSMHRAQSLSVLNPPTGTIDAHQSPFLSPSTRPYGPDQIPQPSLPTPPIATRPAYFAPTAPTPPPGLNRTDIRRPSAGFPQSGSASPIASYSPYSQPASIASSQFESSSQPGSYMTIPNNAQHSGFNNPPIAMETERNMIPMTPSGQSTIQMMTIHSQQGHKVQIPVDVQAASKVADEKRKRNAGASARFRARRKEKEREASMSITRLEQQLREALEDTEFYRNERDYFKTILLQQPGHERHYARPPSPRLRRHSTAPSSTGGGGGSGGSSYSGYSEPSEPHEPERNVRRRTSSYHPAAGTAPTSLNGSGPPPQQSQSYSTSTFPPINPPPIDGHPANRPPPQQFDPREQRPLPELQPPQRPGFRDPFVSDSTRYDNRNWALGPARDNRG
ncbi:uncharacterized protein BDR25DRAFT_322095 [Lindgomyces ingoldianus]|uniref:Uncharacterized protein n=1 Tax=Lindgomyces ingoldianus TaxID=673940 RepID=A0ACB6RBM1_9PLEO|nr:uncharacterized protein BDR25DRAFT_322095 [Lindgomyces ingoldianus]KAF2476733.1 hypothetical protein BDR25DRAFT_322095 [Lindgomyces ingoldianus]